MNIRQPEYCEVVMKGGIMSGVEILVHFAVRRPDCRPDVVT